MSSEEIGYKLIEIQNLIKQSDSRRIPIVFINASEVMRILDISRPTLLQLVKDKIIESHSDDKNNRYLLSEILWLKGTKYKGLDVMGIEKLRQKKSEEFKVKLLK